MRKINTLIEKFTNVWNKHDPKEFAELFVDNGEWTDVLGQHVKGKEQIKKLHEYPFNTVLKDATLTVISVRSRSIRDDIVAIDVEWKTTGNKTPDGKSIPNRNGLLDLIVTLKGDIENHCWTQRRLYDSLFQSELIHDSKYTDVINSS